MQERRRCIRWQINIETEARLEGQEAPLSCRIKDINLKGLCILLARKLKPDTFLRLEILLEKGFRLKVEAWVAWSKSIDRFNMYGVYFKKIGDSDKEKIYQFLQQNFPKQIHNRWWSGIITEKGGGKMDDRRLFERFSVQFPLKVLDLNSGREARGHVYDISAKGLSFMADEALISNTQLEMWLEVPDKGEPFYTRGEVAWSEKIESDKYRVGVNLERANLMGLSRVLRII